MTTVVLRSLTVEIIVESAIGTQSVNDFILCTERQDGGNVGCHMQSVVKLVQTACVHTAAVF